MSDVARFFAARLALTDGTFISQPFVVLSVDYRLACPLTALSSACWRWDTKDLRFDYAQVAVHDLEDVVRWIKSPGPRGWESQSDSHYSWWDGTNIMVLGTSAGGNLVASLAAAASSTSTFRPQASVILSGFPETSITSAGTYPCDSGSTDASSCWTHVNDYLDCLENGAPPDHAVSACQGPGETYEMASPTFGFGGGPTEHGALFIANAGGPAGGVQTDLSPLQLAEDFDSILTSQDLYSEGTSVRLCTVDITGHATGYLDNANHCSDDPTTVEVIESIEGFFLANMAAVVGR